MTLDGPFSSAALECKSDGVKIIALPHYKEMSLGVFKTCKTLAQHFDIVHGHGLWLPLNWATGEAAIKSRKPLVITTHGTLNSNALKHSSLKKKSVGVFFDNRYLQAARCIHAASHDEYEAIRQYGLKIPVSIIPLGIQPKVIQNVIPEQVFKQKHNIHHKSRILLFLSRISWEKGLDDLAEAWSKIAADFTDWQLVIVGPGKPEYVEKLKHVFGANPGGERVLWLGRLEGSEKSAAYSTANLFVLPSHTENFSLVTAEALAAGVPVVTTQGTPWAELPERGCGWWVPVGAEGITMALREAMAMTDEMRREMGLRGKVLIGEKYTWPVIAKQMSEVYEWILGYRYMPTCVRID
jgi:glycosyltransferase involved in cell wall biosynthesis